MSKKSNLGQLIPVDNKDRKFGSADQYVAVRVSDGKGTWPLLFTPNELQQAQERAAANTEDIPRERCDTLDTILTSLITAWGWGKKLGL